ncbi:MAG TPA: T9SS type A sorting domain-containing protein [Puia sp.]|nr:T9SS type A sorting domain-containing protein [Puia sp.]
MKKLLFSGLISCGLLLLTAQTKGQNLFGYAENKMIILRWTTSNEQFIDRYIVERSTDSVHFTTLHEVISKGPFTTEGENTYQDADAWPEGAANFYRIQTVLKAGGSLYTPAIRVDIDPRNRPVLKPTVIHMGGNLFVDNYHSSQPITVDIFNANGTLLGSWLVNGTAFTINTDRLAKGILFYRISDETHPLIDAGKLMIQ